MTGFWAAAERVRGGASAQAAPRPVSRFEDEADVLADTGFERLEPLADDEPPAAPATTTTTPPPEPSQDPAPPPAPPPILTRETIEIRTEPAVWPSAPRGTEPAAIVEATTVSTAAAAPPPTLASATSPLFQQTATATPATSPHKTPVADSVVVDPPGEAPSERPARDTTTEHTTVIVEAAPLAHASEAPPPLASGPEATAPPAVVEAPAFNIQIDRIEIRIDPPAPPAAPASSRRPAPPIALNDYLARSGT
jgi:hypothetical protein